MPTHNIALQRVPQLDLSAMRATPAYIPTMIMRAPNANAIHDIPRLFVNGGRRRNGVVASGQRGETIADVLNA